MLQGAHKLHLFIPLRLSLELLPSVLNRSNVPPSLFSQGGTRYRMKAILRPSNSSSWHSKTSAITHVLLLEHLSSTCMIHSNNCFPALSPHGYDKKKTCSFQELHFHSSASPACDLQDSLLWDCTAIDRWVTLKVQAVIHQQQFFHHLYFILRHCFAADSLWDPLELE